MNDAVLDFYSDALVALLALCDQSFDRFADRHFGNFHGVSKIDFTNCFASFA